jgi:hypothetical protein
VKIYDYRDQWGDLLEIHVTDGDGSGVAICMIPRHGMGKWSVFLAGTDARAMVTAVAGTLGYDLVVKDGEPRG